MESNAIIRGMANTLTDSDTDLIDDVTVITRLVTAGWPTKDIEQYYKSAVTMALARRINDRRNALQSIK
jgi:hypothetical protein